MGDSSEDITRLVNDCGVEEVECRKDGIVGGVIFQKYPGCAVGGFLFQLSSVSKITGERGLSNMTGD